MGIAERREREKEQRRKDILAAAWAVAEEVGWASFSVERVAAVAMAGVAVPELRANTPLRRRWQDFVLAVTPVHDRGLRPAEPGSAPEPPRKRDP